MDAKYLGEIERGWPSPLLRSRPSAGPEVFETCHRHRDLIGTGDLWLEAFDEPAQRVRGDDDTPEVVLIDEADEVRLGTLRHTLWSAC